MVDNQLAVWMEQQSDNSYTMKYLPFNFSPAAVAGNSPVAPLSVTGTAQNLVTGIDSNVLYVNWSINTSSNKFLMEYETLSLGSTTTKDVYINTFTVNGSGNNVVATTSGAASTGANAGAKLILPGIKSDAITAIYNPPDSSTIFIYEKTLADKNGLLMSTLNPASGLIAETERFLEIGSSSSNTKIDTCEYGTVSNSSSVSTQTITIMGVTTSTPGVTVDDKTTYKLQFYKGDTALSGAGGISNLIPTDSLTLSNRVKAMWNQANIGNDTTLFAFQDGNVVHAVQVGSDGKIITDDQFAIPAGSTFDRYRPLGNTKSTVFEFFWREPIASSTTGETTIKSRIYDPRNNTSITIAGYSGNPFNLVAGGIGNDLVVGKGNDVLAGGPGNDNITGVLGGKDVVSYLGKSTDYLITPDFQDPFKVAIKDIRSGSPDGTDIVVNVPTVRFADKAVSLFKSSLEKPLTQNFLTVNSGITYSTSTSSKGFMGVTGMEPGNFAVRIISGNGKDLPNNVASLLDAIVNANSVNGFMSAVQSAKAAGANSSPPFALDIVKNITSSIDLNVDGTKDEGVKIPLEVDPQTSTVNNVSLNPREVKVMPQSFVLTLSNNFLTVSKGIAKISGGQSGANSSSNGSWINNANYNFTGNETYSIKLNFRTRDDASPMPASALQIAAKMVAASTPDQFTNALYELWNDSTQSSTPYYPWITAALADQFDVNGDSKPDFNLMMQLIFNAPAPGDSTINFSLS